MSAKKFFVRKNELDAFCCKAISETLDAKLGTPHPQRLRILTAERDVFDVYSIAIALYDWIPGIESYDVQLMATFSDDRQMQQASRARFDSDDLAGLPSCVTRQHFVRDGESQRIHDRVRMMVYFQAWDMLSDLGPRKFDIVFGPLVEGKRRKDINESLANYLANDGYLFSQDEQLHDLGERFAPHQHCHSVFYRPCGVPSFAAARHA